MKKIGFFIGSENYLNHTRTLCKSIYENTSFAKEYEVYAVTPEHIEITVDIPMVYQIKVEIPQNFRSIPFIDKMLAAAEFEKICDDGYIWIDVDSYFFKSVEISDSAEMHVNPVDKKNIGDAYDEEQSAIWKIAYKYFELSPMQSYVITSVTKEKIFPYFNAGLVVVNKHRELFKMVKKAIYDLLANYEIKKIIDESVLHKIFIHQVIFSCCIIKLYGDNIKLLPQGVNYPFHLHDSNPSPIPLENLVSIRYDNYFDSNNPPLIWKHIFDHVKDGLKSNWYY